MFVPSLLFIASGKLPKVWPAEPSVSLSLFGIKPRPFPCVIDCYRTNARRPGDLSFVRVWVISHAYRQNFMVGSLKNPQRLPLSPLNKQVLWAKTQHILKFFSFPQWDRRSYSGDSQSFYVVSRVWPAKSCLYACLMTLTLVRSLQLPPFLTPCLSAHILQDVTLWSGQKQVMSWFQVLRSMSAYA